MRTLEIWTGWENCGQIGGKWERLDGLRIIRTFSHFRRFMRAAGHDTLWLPEIKGKTLVWRKHYPRTIANNRIVNVRWVGSERLRRRGYHLERVYAMRVLMEGKL